ncbi:NACHT, LRR and PYD domains-containing protein 12-like [Stegostoma tigrinum]|uniref:NACHT, LRR and PYD domains-containing protein 12-like n=1 Tax=Stegostoma tigrinum TaxID=3053191 RepID=UPI0028708599|nr:NACHT, LRR and PYD domains-containing protein 12-like [Stegostoma tigrinum]
MDEKSNQSQEGSAATSGNNSAEMINKDHLSDLGDEELSENPRTGPELQHRENLRKQTMMLRFTTTSGRYKSEVDSLEEAFIDTMIVAPIRDPGLVENELNSRGKEREKVQRESIKNMHQVRVDQLLRSGSERDKFGTTVVFGAAGIGKSTLVQKIIHDWAAGRMYQEFKFVFQLNIPALNLIKVKTNLNTLILNSYPYLVKSLKNAWEDPGSILFIFDDIDQFDSGMDLTDLDRCKNPQNQCFDAESLHCVSDIVRCLIEGYLLHGCSVLVTSRPWKMGNLTKTKINLRGEILGFTSESIKQYFRRHFGDEQLATDVMESIQWNETLYTMCYNPLYCSVLSSLLETGLGEREEDGPLLIPTNTDVFSAYVTKLLARCGYGEGTARAAMLKLGELAWKGICKKAAVFDSDQFNQQELEASNLISSFIMEIGDSCNVTYAFSHSVLQDFIAALGKSLATPEKCLVQLLYEGFTCSDNRFEIFSRFLIGLLSQNSTSQLDTFLGNFPPEATHLVSVWLKDNIKKCIKNTENLQSQRVFLHLMHCFVEFQDKQLTSGTFLPLQSITFNQLRLKPSDCAALSISFLHVEQIEELNLSACEIQAEGLYQLGPVLPKCKILRLNRNDFGVSEINLLSAALKKQNCKIQMLELKSNKLTDDRVEDLISALRANGSLVELDLSDDNQDEVLTNRLTDKCISSLYHLFKYKRNLKEIRLMHNHGIAEEHQILLSHLSTDQDQNAPKEILPSADTDRKDSIHKLTHDENPCLQENQHHQHECTSAFTFFKQYIN